jgi:hypothetical protein
MLLIFKVSNSSDLSLTHHTWSEIIRQSKLGMLILQVIALTNLRLPFRRRVRQEQQPKPPYIFISIRFKIGATLLPVKICIPTW